MKTIRKLLNYFFIGIGFLVVYLLATVALSYIPVNKNQSQNAPQNLSVYILTNGVHTDVVLPFKNAVYDWSVYLDPSLTEGQTTRAQWVGFGWGDKGFYLQTPEWKDLKPSVALNAVLGLSESAMHVTYHEKMFPNEDCVEIKLNEKQYRALCNFVFQRFDTQNGHFQPIITDQNYGLSDVFYEAQGSYSLFCTCNTWANNALKAAGLKASLFTLWDKGIFYHYKK